ncbi:hypothetical protein N9X05_19110 [Paracoccaceae bacterium]|nr:hypothetical protein [Paracoccaceae bacterium]
MLKSDHIATSLTSLRYLALFFPLFPFDMSVVENARGHAMRAALIALLLMFGSQAGAKNVLYCSTEANLATGIAKDNGQWRSGGFEEKRFSLKETGNFSSVEIKEYGIFTCNRPYMFAEPGGFLCHNKIGSTFMYIKETQKFIFFACSLASYVNDEYSDSCSIYAGSCDSF